MLTKRHIRVASRSLAALALAAFAAPGSASAPRAIATIKPVHALVAGVMRGVGEPVLLIAGGVSPHTYTLRPSDARALHRAELVFWIGSEYETFLTRSLRGLDAAEVVTLSEIDGLALHATRKGGAWEADDDHGGAAGPAGTHMDMHIWLDPRNARAMARAIAQALEGVDPEHGAAYRANANRLARRLEALDGELRAALKDTRAAPFVVFHDAYRYFEARYGLNAVGSVAVSSGRPPGARRLVEIRERIRALQSVCVFSEPQFEPRVLRAVADGLPVRSGVLDPLGAALALGEDAYFALLRGLAASMRACLQPAAEDGGP